MKGIYLDHNATTPPLPSVVEAMVGCLQENWGNPSSSHAFGQAARRALDRARAQVAELIQAEPDEVFFTSGGTESNNQVLLSLPHLEEQRHLVVSSIEHQAVLNPSRHLITLGIPTTELGVDEQGLVDLDHAGQCLVGGPALVSVMLANNDLGTLQPLAELAGLCRRSASWLHSDAVQAAGKIPIDVKALGVDFLSLSAHKIGGPKGVGALFIRRGLKLPSLLFGGSQERKTRSGTENLPGIVGFGVAAAASKAGFQTRVEQLRHLRDKLQADLLEIPGATLNGHPVLRLPNTLNVSFEGVVSEDLVLNLDLEGIAISTGSACSSAARQASYVMRALGRSEEQARESARFSLGELNTEAEIDRTIQVVHETVTRLRGVH